MIEPLGRAPIGLEGLESFGRDWRETANELWRARLGWPQTVRRIASGVREATVRRGDAADTARIDLVLLSVDQFDRQAVRSGTEYATHLARVFEAAGDAEWRALALLHAARDRMMQGADDAADALLAWLDHEGEAAHVIDRAWAQAARARVLSLRGEEETGFRLGYEAVALLQGTTPSPERVFAVMNLGVAHQRFGNLRTGEALLADAFDTARMLDMREAFFLLAANVASIQLDLGMVERAQQTLAAVSDIPDRPPERHYHELMMSLALLMGGDIDGARAWFNLAAQAPTGERPPAMLQDSLRIEIALLRAEGRLEEALAVFRQAEATTPAALNHVAHLHLLSEAASLFADLENWEQAYVYERRHREGYRALQHHAARVERFAVQARYDLYRSQVERDFERQRREHAEAARATVQALNDNLSTRLSEIQALQSALQEQVITDPLTLLYNRRFLNEVLPRELERAARDGGSIVVAMLDLDGFKQINDLHGHTMGDQVLRQLAGLLREQTRVSDFCCRYGGEEFCLVLTGLDAEGAESRIKGILDAFGHVELDAQGGRRISELSFSAGVAAYPAHGSHVEALLSLADAALLRAKRAGKRRVYRCDPAIDRPGRPDPHGSSAQL
ncbi:hypothetical protein GCM10025771_33320 [Niveibacterium umoris]|uniref:diguanylate cyclase n=1 Tax=Niveibacterium umoris TaxID=1193620 RepID=A0A840BED2_9RHOO|nr:GGDEF domain-containing protein [Niveibacterium umoris]MBB4011475.1 diguanylate cyclase (GGDEF)-like protein [Niveibacterium umoris]